MSDKHANIPELLFAPTRSRDRGDNEAKCPFRFPAWSKHLETCHNGSEKIIKDHERNHFGAEFIPSNLRVTKRITYYIYIYTCHMSWDFSRKMECASRSSWISWISGHSQRPWDRQEGPPNESNRYIDTLCRPVSKNEIASHCITLSHTTKGYSNSIWTNKSTK